MFGSLSESEQRFLEFLHMLGSTALYQLGIIANPINGKIEQDLNAARSTIDLLILLKEKTKGNLSNVEKNSLEELVNHLQINFIEKKKESSKSGVQEPAKQGEKVSGTGEKKEEISPSEKLNSDDVELNWEKHQRKNYGSSEKTV